MGWVKTEKTNKLSKLGDIDFTTTAPVNGNALVYDETNDVWVPGEGGGSSGVELTQAEYDQLTQEEKNNGSIYKITDKAKIYCLDEEYHAVLEITSADYALLTSAEKNNGTLYVITDEETTAADIPYSQDVSVADKLDNVPTFDTLTTSDNNKLLGVSVSGSDISVGAVGVSSLVKSVLLTSSMNCNYQDSSTIGYRSTTSDKVDITGITGYPTGKKILGTAVEYAYCGSVSEYYKISQLNIVNNETWANSKVGGTVRFGVRVYYLDV